jgi:hypothetical protein
MMRVLSKSRFKIGLECPNKLYFTHHKDQYPSTKTEDTFLLSLAQGGFQVEELARMHYPGGVLVDSEYYDYADAVDKTNILLQQENVVIYEAAFLWNNLFIRTDILNKQGNRIDLIEVKAKLHDPNNEYAFVGKQGKLVSSWKPYLFDLAFQKYVLSKSHPDFAVKASLMMADKNKRASIDGLNQMFRVPAAKDGDQRKDIIKRVQTIEETGNSILSVVDVNAIVDNIIRDTYPGLNDHSFEKSIQYLLKIYQEGTYPKWPTNYSACKNCEFKATDEQLAAGLKSGFHFCMNRQHDLTPENAKSPNIFDIWDFRSATRTALLQENRILLDQLNEEHINPEYKDAEISASQRRWIQVEKAQNRDSSILLLKDELKDEMDNWDYPLHFIDFETSGVALPFTKGRRPYEQVAFQFSHHIMEQDGTVRHQTEFISNKPGEFPNFKFARALKEALGKDSGTIFKFASHENTIINAIIGQLRDSQEPDKEDLITFLKTISTSTNDNVEVWEGPRSMVDLRKIVLKYYYNPLTKGSNSIKAVLPAALQSSDFLRVKYAKPLNEIGVTSQNFPGAHIWLPGSAESFMSPYKMLPPLFEGWEEEEREDLVSGIDDISDGGMALTAYAKLQFVDMSEKERDELTTGLKKYCELDTLAMVMIYEHFKELVE